MLKTTVKEYAYKKNISKTEASRILNRIVKKKTTIKEMQPSRFNCYGGKNAKVTTYYYIADKNYF